MQGYTVNFKSDGYDEISISNTGELNNENIIVLLDNSCDNQLKEYYAYIRQLIINYNKVILLDKGSRITNQLGMLMCLYGRYDIYKVEDSSLTKDYIDMLLEREPTLEEVETFIGADIVGFAEINNIITQIIDSVKAKDIDSLTAVIGDNINEIEGLVGLIDYLRTMTEGVILGKDKTKELKDSIVDLQKKVSNQEEEIKELEDSKAQYKKELSKAKADVITLTDKLNSINDSEPTLWHYNTLKTQICPCKVKSIIYFKEVSHISYINSFVTNLIMALEKIRQLRVKLIIYDNKTAFLNTYKPITLVTPNDYASDRTRVVSTLKKMLLTEVNQAILQDVIAEPWDVVIVYDRLRQAEDIISGNIVYKYWVLNSIKEFSVIEKEFKVKENEVITRPGVLPGALTISTNSEYKEGNENARLAYYCSKMRNTGSNNELVFDSIFKRTNIINIVPNR